MVDPAITMLRRSGGGRRRPRSSTTPARLRLARARSAETWLIRPPFRCRFNALAILLSARPPKAIAILVRSGGQLRRQPDSQKEHRPRRGRPLGYDRALGSHAPRDKDSPKSYSAHTAETHHHAAAIRRWSTSTP